MTRRTVHQRVRFDEERTRQPLSPGDDGAHRGCKFGQAGAVNGRVSRLAGLVSATGVLALAAFVATAKAEPPPE